MMMLNRIGDREEVFKKVTDNEDYWTKTQIKQYEEMTKVENTYVYKTAKDFLPCGSQDTKNLDRFAKTTA